MRPIGKNIVIKTIEEEIKTNSGLLLSAEDTKSLRYKKAIVVAVGSDVSVIKKGETIQYDKRAGYTMLIKDEQFTIIQEKDVVLVL
tara:strand:- start:239 stop:496 length:258 start_codon:yes stop_codon:yes gene_type:complete